MYSYKFAFACFIFFVAQIVSWFAFNSQFVWEWWKDKALLACVLFGLPSMLMFWYGNRLAYEAMGELWGPRFMSFGISYMVFPFLTWWLLNESMFTAKTMICIGLSLAIMLVQIFMVQS